MTGDFQLATRAEVFKRELYRNPKEPEFGVDLWRSDAPSWRDVLMLKIGNLLISLGTQLKDSARPQAVLSQEML